MFWSIKMLKVRWSQLLRHIEKMNKKLTKNVAVPFTPSKMILNLWNTNLRGESYINFCTQCVIIALAGGGYCSWRFENEKSYRISKVMASCSPSVQAKYKS